MPQAVLKSLPSINKRIETGFFIVKRNKIKRFNLNIEKGQCLEIVTFILWVSIFQTEYLFECIYAHLSKKIVYMKHFICPHFTKVLDRRGVFRSKFHVYSQLLSGALSVAQNKNNKNISKFVP